MTFNWFFASDIPKHDPKLKTNKSPQIWEKFPIWEEERLELNFKEQKLVQLYPDFLFEVDLKLMLRYSIYWPGPLFEVRRSRWFVFNSNKWIPCEKEMDELLELGYLEIKPFLFKVCSVDFPTRYEVPEHKYPIQNQFAVYTSDCAAWIIPESVSKIKSLITQVTNSLGQKAIRGYQNLPQVKEEEKPNEKQFDHLLLVVHGIGSKLSEKTEAVNFVNDVNQLRRSISNSMKKEKSVFVIPVHWRQSISFGDGQQLEEEDDEFVDKEMEFQVSDKTSNERYHHPSLDEININGSVPLIRTLISDVFLDILLYMTPHHRKRIISTVASEMNRLYHLFKSRHPYFTGGVSIFGHSLGSLIIMQIVTEFNVLKKTSLPCIPHVAQYLNENLRKYDSENLNFDVDLFFCVGSPIGYLMLLQDERLRPIRFPLDSSTLSKRRPRVKSLFNIFSKYDPVAIRLEPLISREFVSMDPLNIPYHKGGLKGLQQDMEQMTSIVASRAIDAFKSSTQLFSSIFKPLGSSHESFMAIQPINDEDLDKKSGGIRLLNPKYGRVDFALQQGILENPYIAALSIHMCYWADPDIGAFVSGELLDAIYKHV